MSTEKTVVVGNHESDLVRLREPLNVETDLADQKDLLTPVDSFFIRNHFTVPDRPELLEVRGRYRRTFTVEDLQRFPQRSLVTTMECAGNGRALLEPPTGGVPWRLGAVGTAEWTGVSLAHILDAVGVPLGVVEILFEAADAGEVPAAGQVTDFARSLSLQKALHEDTLLACEMNREPLTPEHGAPIRLIVPGWYGMASVKWLRRISCLTKPFDGYFQAQDYVVHTPGFSRPCREMAVRALITSPSEGSVLSPGLVEVRGYAWSGTGMIERVELSDDGGRSWRPCRLTTGSPSPYAWVPWTVDWEVASPGGRRLLVRATDDTGEQQPLEPVWNERGYSNNGCSGVTLRVQEAVV